MGPVGIQASSVTGGSIGYLTGRGSSTVDVSGGTISKLSAYQDSIVTIHGYDFRGTAGLRLEDELVLEAGVLTGKWLDGTSWITTIPTIHPTATIRVAPIPEPSTLTLLFMGVVGLLAYGLRRK